MEIIDGFELTETLHADGRVYVARGRRLEDGVPVVVKTLAATAEREDAEYLRYGYRFLLGLDLPGVARPLDFVRHDGRPTAVFEDIGARSTEQIRRDQTLSPVEVATLGVAVAEVIGELHQRHVLHKDIEPSNVVANLTTGQVQLIDFKHATRMASECLRPHDPVTLRTKPAYMAPERTGNTSRPIDHRTDLYSVGSTLYYLLTGRPPFDDGDLLALNRRLLVDAPRSPIELEPSLPVALSRIVSKLMAKAPEDRYQSAHGLTSDLRECLDHLTRSGDVPDDFEVGRYDVPTQFRVSQRLYGRATEIRTVVQQVSAVEEGAARLLLVEGHAGVGKSSLVDALRLEMTNRQAREYEVRRQDGRGAPAFLSGKFDQLQNVPYAALLQGFDEFVDALLATEDDAEIDRWRQAILAEVGGLGQVLIERVAGLGRILGAQPVVPALPSAEAANRLQWVVQAFVRAICSRCRPTVLFLDDVQWATSASLKLVQALLTNQERGGLLVVGAYRHEEIGPAHPVARWEDELRDAPFAVRRLRVEPLDSSAVTQLVADTVFRNTGDAGPLAEVVFRKTRGDPFFIWQFLRAMHTVGALRFAAGPRRWEWDLAHVERMQVSDNVADLVSLRLEGLPPTTQAVLGAAACVGARFEFGRLTQAADLAPEDVVEALLPALEAGVIVAEDPRWRLAARLGGGHAISYRFPHDRVQDAAYRRQFQGSLQTIHLRIGRTLLATGAVSGSRTTASRGSHDRARFFEAVNQLNAGHPALEEERERLELCRLNLKAGQDARDVGAFAEAHQYLRQGLDLLAAFPGRGWTDHPRLALDLHLAGAEAAYLVAERDEDFEAVDELLTAVDHVRRPDVRARVATIQVHAGISRSKPDRVDVNKALLRAAIEKGLVGLRHLGFKIPEHRLGVVFRTMLELVRTTVLMRGQRPERLLGRPAPPDPEVEAALNLLQILNQSCYMTRPDLFPLLILKTVQLAVRDGHRKVSAFALTNYALLRIILFGETRCAKRYGDLALQLVEAGHAAEHGPKARFMVCNFLSHWYAPLRDVVDPVYAIYDEAREAGDLQIASMATVMGIYSMVTSGRPLLEVVERAGRYSAAIRRQERAYYLHELVLQRVHNLLGRAPEVCEIAGETGFDEREVVPRLEAAQDRTTLCGYHLVKTWLGFLFHRPDQMRRHATLTVDCLDGLLGAFQAVQAQFYNGMVLLQTLPPGPRRWPILWHAWRHLHKLERAAKRSPDNFGHWAALLRAEWWRAWGWSSAAQVYFQKAIEAAAAGGLLEDQAIANELAARAYLTSGHAGAAEGYLRQAYRTYAEWGAEAKLEQLRMEFPWLGSAVKGGELDALGLQRASQAISREVALDSLVRQLLVTVVETAGADSATLFLRDGHELVVEAQLVDPAAPPRLGMRQPMAEATGFAVSIVRYVERRGTQEVLDDASSDYRFRLDPHFGGKPRSVLCTPIVKGNLVVAVLYLENSRLRGAFSPARVETLQALSGQIAISLDNARLYEAQSRFVPTQFLRALGRDNIVSVAIGDHVEKEELSVLFSDVRGFTSLVESASPRESIDFVNRYFGRMEPAILEHGGFIDSYVGDAIMAIFEGGADQAVAAAVEMMGALEQLNQERRAQGAEPLASGIGISTGKVVLGTIGGQHRLNCSVIGDSVNVASRVESLTKRYQVPLLVSDSTFDELDHPDVYAMRRVDTVRVDGRYRPVTLYEVMAGDHGLASSAKRTHRDLFAEGTGHYFGRDLSAALTCFERYARLVPGDVVGTMYVDRCRRYLADGLPADWDGVAAL